MNFTFSLIFNFSAFLFTVAVQPAAAFEVPALTAPVIDEANILSAQTESELNNLLRSVQSKNMAQVQILTLSSLQGLPIEQASIQIVDKWRMGDAKSDNGILFLIAPTERQMRIEVGQGLEGVFPDVYAKRIIADIVTPAFRKGDYNGGVIAGTISILRYVAPDLANTSGARGNMNRGSGIRVKSKVEIVVFILFFIFFFLNMAFGRHRRGLLGSSRGGRYVGGWGSGGGGWGSGGGGWSGGGGGFSGGGASGGW